MVLFLPGLYFFKFLFLKGTIFSGKISESSGICTILKFSLILTPVNPVTLFLPLIPVSYRALLTPVLMDATLCLWNSLLSSPSFYWTIYLWVRAPNVFPSIYSTFYLIMVACRSGAPINPSLRLFLSLISFISWNKPSWVGSGRLSNNISVMKSEPSKSLFYKFSLA